MARCLGTVDYGRKVEGEGFEEIEETQFESEFRKNEYLVEGENKGIKCYCSSKTGYQIYCGEEEKTDEKIQLIIENHNDFPMKISLEYEGEKYERLIPSKFEITEFLNTNDYQFNHIDKNSVDEQFVKDIKITISKDVYSLTEEEEQKQDFEKFKESYLKKQKEYEREEVYER